MLRMAAYSVPEAGALPHAGSLKQQSCGIVLHNCASFVATYISHGRQFYLLLALLSRQLVNPAVGEAMADSTSVIC